MRLLRHILFASILPILALLLALAFAPAGPPSASATSEAALETPPAVEVCHNAPASWLDAILGATRDLLS